jgi:tripartite-type tricarboxylate transporter receptor subunit TctC
MLAHVDMVHVPYKGSYVPDLLSGQSQVVFAPIPTVIAHIKSGKLRGLAVTSTKRSPAVPDTPTIAEFVPGYDASGYFGFGAPAATPEDIVDTLNKTINATITDPPTKEKLTALGVEPQMMMPAQYGKLIADETEKWSEVVVAAHMTIN